MSEQSTGRPPLRIDDEAAGPPSRRAPGSPGAPAGAVGALVLVLGLLGILLWGSMLLAPYRLTTGLLDARDHIKAAQKALTKTQLKQARYETLAAVASAERARSGLSGGGPALDLLRAVPSIDDALGEVDHIIAAVEHTADAALGTLNVAQDSLRGPRSVIVEDPADEEGKKIDLQRLAEIGTVISEVRTDVEAARTELKAVDQDKVPGRVRDQVNDALKDAKEASKTIADAEAGLQLLPAILGADGPRTYVFGFQNSAEQRGTGGAILRFSFLQITDGSPFFDTDTSSVYDVDTNREQITIDVPEDAWYVANIPDAQRFGNANWSPDFPSAAELTLRYAQATPTEAPFPDVDGFFVIDPVAAQELMPGIGPYRTEFGNRISTRKIVDFMLNRAYGIDPVPAKRRMRLNQVVDGFYDGMFDPLHPTELLEGFGDALAGKHMQIWMTDPEEQRFVEHMGWDGAITPPDELEDDDYVYVVEQNVGGSKLDYFDTNVNTMDIGFDGSDAVISTEMRVTNGVFLPQPRYSMGDSQIPAACAKARCPLHRPMLNLYVRDDAELVSASEDGTRIDAPPSVATWLSGVPPEHLEHGKKVWSSTLEIPPLEEGAITFDYRVPGVVQSRGARKVYRLHVQHQPKVRPETLIVRLTLPEGARAIRAKGFERDGDTLVWEEQLMKDLILEVSWRE